MKETRSSFLINSLKREGKGYPLDQFFSDEILPFHQHLSGYAPTPLNVLHSLPIELQGKKVFLKDESMRFSIGAFKSLGASWAIHSFLKKNPGSYTLCSATDGNHGRAVAWSARMAGHEARIFMPASTVPARIKFIENEGAEVCIVDGDYDTTVEAAKENARKNGHILIQDTSWEGYELYPHFISAGYTTLLKEIENQMSVTERAEVKAVFLQSGVGSWAASTVLYCVRKALFPAAKFIIVEPFESDCLLESARSGRISATKKSQVTIMAGLNCGTPSLSAWEIIHDLADAFISIDDYWAKEAIRYLFKSGYETCESGAAGFAGLWALAEEASLRPLYEETLGTDKGSFLVINTEGITDPAMFKEIISTG
jgi:diaminopropionate ammonia-lyase